MKIAILTFNACMTSAVAGLVDAFGLATLAAQKLRPSEPTQFETIVLSTGGASITGSGGFVIQPKGDLRAAQGCDVIVVPPIMGDIAAVLSRERELVSWLERSAERTGIVCSVCTGAFLLAEAGLLHGRRATTTPVFSELFEQRFPNVALDVDQRIVDEQSIICAGTTSAFLDLAIYLIDKFAGHDIAVWTAKALSKDKNVSSQRPYFLFVGRRDHGDQGVLLLQEWMESNYTRPIAAADLVKRSTLSLRSLNRRFRAATGLSPMDYLRRLRIEAAKRLLETGDTTVEEIKDAVGYDDTRAFARLFRATVGLSPSAYRQRFHARRPLTSAAACR